MQLDNIRDNHVMLIGKIIEPPAFVCEHDGSKYYDGLVRYDRQSGVNFDRIPITADRLTARVFQETYEIDRPDDTIVMIEGRIVSRTRELRMETAVEYPMAVKVEGFTFIVGPDTKPTNNVEIRGYVCENPIFRATLSGRQICELTISVPKGAHDGAQNYIKCIAWDGAARFASKLYIGAFVEGRGRFQSRMYTKRLDDGRTVQRYAYEVSLYTIADGRM